MPKPLFVDNEAYRCLRASDVAGFHRLIAKLDPLFPAENFPLNWVLCETLVALQSPTIAAKGIAALKNAPGQEEQMEYARSLRMLKAGWTKELHERYFNWFLKAANYRGGASFEKFIEFIRTGAEETLTAAEKTTLAELLAKKPVKKSPLEALAEAFAGRTHVEEWKLDELATAAEKGLTGRSYDNGRKMFGAAACFACHRFGNEGGMTGPDLTGAGGRYNARDFLDQIINPSKEINEQFVPIVLTKEDGETITGIIVNLNGDSVPDLAIASDGLIASVAVYAKGPIDRVRTLALDTSSRTSVALTKILCAKRWGIAPAFTPAAPDLPAMLAGADAALLIGDLALEADAYHLRTDVWTSAGVFIALSIIQVTSVQWVDPAVVCIHSVDKTTCKARPTPA